MLINTLEYLKHTSLLFPEKTAFVCGEKSYNYAEAIQKAHAIASKIVSSDVKDSPIPIFFDKGSDAIVAMIAVLMSGNYYCPIDVKAPKDRITKIISSLEAPLVLFSNDQQDFGLDSTTKTIYFDQEVTSNTDLTIIWQDIANWTFGKVDTDPCYIIFTSGSTGMPKGVVVSHRSVIDYIEWARTTYNISEKENIGNQAPFYFDNSVLDIYLTFACGCTLFLVPEINYAFPAKLLTYLEENKINFVFWVPTVLITIANQDLLAGKNRLPGLKKVLFAGEVMPVPQINYWVRSQAKDVLFSNLYGPTEITVDCTFFNLNGEWNGPSLPIGKECRNSSVLIINAENKLCHTGEIGELCVRGSSLALGYWKNREKTDSAFMQNPLHDNYNDLIYRTGDLVMRDEEGLIFFTGRKDQQIKHNGYRIELGEIESAISELSVILSNCVLYNQEAKEIIVFYTAKSEIDLKVFRIELAKKLPKYMIPTKFNYLDEMPLTPNGKINRQLLKTKF